MAAPLIHLRSIFLDALARPAADRPAFLDAACGGNTALRSEVEGLLDAHLRADNFLGGAAAIPEDGAAPPSLGEAAPSDGSGTRPRMTGTSAERPNEAAGTVLAGRYKLVEEIGSGGMGRVWLASQTEPVKRLVAVKLIRPGMASRQVLARFEAERQALALMDHPNIAQVLDAGTAPDGRPFIVMELVKGMPITRFCDERGLTPRERLALFVPVCQAIQHAHQKGVIHRDIKPTNVLVALYDGRPVPKVIDFGVAKAVGEPLTEATLHTGFGLVGTPEYMAPEQAELNQLDVDTRADVYALGVLLYELLTGTPPFARADLPGLLDVLRAVRETEPARPSTRLSSSAALPTLAARRNTDPRKLAGLVRGELDWIALKALAKDRDRRYETVSGLARDVERYLAGEPVHAVPPSAGYRLRTFVRRNRGPVAAALLLVLALAGGVAGTAAGLSRAAGQRDAAVRARHEADEEREVAEAVTAFLREDLLGQADSERQAAQHHTPDPNLTVRTALDRAAARVGDRFRDRPRVEAAVRKTIGAAYLAVGESDTAAAQLERAVALLAPPAGTDPKSKAAQSHTDALRLLAVCHGQRRPQTAIELFKRVLAAREAAFGRDAPETLAAVQDLAGPYAAWSDGKTRSALFRRVVEARTRTLGPNHPATRQAQFDLAWASADDTGVRNLLPFLEGLVRERTRDTRGTTGRPDPAALKALNQLAGAYLFLGRSGDAARAFERLRDACVAIYGLNHGFTLQVLAHLSVAHERCGDRAACVRAREQVWEGWKAGHGANHPTSLAAAFDLAEAYRSAGRVWDAVRVIEETLPACRAVFGARAWATVDRIRRLIPMLEQMGQFERAAELRDELKGVLVWLVLGPHPILE